MNQGGFDFFGGNDEPDFKEDPAGTWNESAPRLTTEEHNARLEAAGVALTMLPPLLQAMYVHGIKRMRDDQACMLRRGPRDDAYGLMARGFQLEAATMGQFLALCRGSLSGDGVEYKTRNEHRQMTAGIYVEGVGSLVLHIWRKADGDQHSVSYSLHRCTFFRRGYDDDRTEFEVPAGVWAKAYCADKLAYSGDGIASVPTFTYAGREWVNTGGLSSGTYRNCNAWSIRPQEDWNGPTYTYTELIRAMDEGRIERGEHRGHLIRVRGKVCVMDAPGLFFDENVTEAVYAVEETDDEEPGDEPPEELDEEEGEEAFA